MRIEVKGRNLPVSEELRQHVEKRFRVISRQVSELADLEVELREELKCGQPRTFVAEATLRLKGVTLRACAASRDLMPSVNRASEELTVQVKRHRDKRRARRETPPAVAA